MLKCFQLLADALNQILTLEQALVPSFPKQLEAMLKCMTGAKVSSGLLGMHKWFAQHGRCIPQQADFVLFILLCLIAAGVYVDNV